MDISIIIINYNTLQLTINCIESIKATTQGINYEIILIDNASNDGSKEYFSQRNDIIYLYLNNNVGFGKANNIGFQKAKGKYIFLLNSDTIILNNALEHLLYYAHKCQNWGCLGCQLLTKEQKPGPSFGYYLSTKRVLIDSLKSYIRCFGFKYNQPIYKTSSTPYNVEVIIGADLFIKRSTIEKLGLFDTRYFMYHEENDLQLRYHKEGLKSIIIPKAKIIHLESQSTKIPFNKKIMTTTSLFIYIKKWSSPLSYFFFRIFFFVLKIPYVLSTELNKKQKIGYVKLLIKKIA